MGLDFEGTDRFQVITRLGEGAMGVVYQALDRDSNARVAVKTLRDLDADRLLRFKNEFRSLQGLQHRNLVSLGELIEANGRWFFTMELVDGVDFYRYVRPRRTPDQRAFPDEATAPAAAPWQRPPPSFDETRLRDAMGQLVCGLDTLHRAGFVHRDVKPSNILVTGEGRVVLLDFGFVIGVAEHSSDRVVGTAAYMAPEQAASMPVGPEADWYSVGAILYEALTGSPPIDGTPLEVLMQKQHRAPTPPSAEVTGVPEDLDRLCSDLLTIRPGDRPDADEILQRLGRRSAAAASTPTPSSSMSLSGGLFVGRETELARLDAAYDEMLRDGSVSVFVHGESGIGKSALVSQFLRRVQSRDREALVFESRCYERESVPYKAFDGIVDALSQHLSSLDPVDAALLLPPHISTLAEVFPVLRQAEVVARAVRPLSTDTDPSEQRARMFGALRDIFTQLAARRRVILAIDDFQWADADSLVLLRALFRRPSAPPLLLVTTIRDDGPRRRSAPKAPDAGLDRIHRLRLRGLDRDEASRLAEHLLRNAAPDLGEHAAAIVDESDGHPLFIDEMIRYGAAIGAAPAALHLDSALWARVLGLPQEARCILELVSVSDAPLRKGVASSAARMPFDEFARWVSALRIGKLVQTTGARRDDHISIFHDRVRRAVLKNLDLMRLRECHERLALAMETSGTANAEAMAIHWSGAGDDEKAFGHLLTAASQAEHALAFERAARLYRRAIDLLPPGAAELGELQARLGDTLADAGRSAEAASVYLAAARSAPKRQLELSARAATEFIRSGHVDSGFEVLRSSLSELGVGVASSPKRALVSLLTIRGRLLARGLRFRRRGESELSERELARLDTTWGLAVGLGLIDTIRGAEIQGRHLLLALRAGEPYRVARALAVEAAYRLAQGRKSERSGTAVLERARELAAEMDRPELDGTIELMAGVGDLCLGRYASAAERCQRAEDTFRDRCYGVRWELSTAQIIRFWAQWYLGQLGELGPTLTLRLREARERGDRYAATTIQTMFRPLARLAEDRPDKARAGAATALERWSQRGFHFQHYCHLYAQTHVDLYEGDAAAAVTRLDRQWSALDGSLLLSVQQSRIEALHLRARAELALAASRGGDDTLVRRVRKRAGAIEAESCPWAEGLARLLRAGAAHLSGDDADAIAELERAAPSLREHGMALFAAAADRARGQLQGGSAGAELVRVADATFGENGVAAAAPFGALLVPGVTA